MADKSFIEQLLSTRPEKKPKEERKKPSEILWGVVSVIGVLCVITLAGFLLVGAYMIAVAIGWIAVVIFTVFLVIIALVFLASILEEAGK